jgi:hypothetical protein
MRNAGNMFAEGTLPEFSDMEDKTAAGLIDDNNMDVIKWKVVPWSEKLWSIKFVGNFSRTF